MTIKNILMLGGVLAGAAYLQDKKRRDRLVCQARDLLDKAKTRASGLADQVESKAHQVASWKGDDDGVGTSERTSSSSHRAYGGGGSGQYR